MNDATYKPMSDYGVIGNLRTVALVGTDGSIDWCCMPDFDSPSVFASLLDVRTGGLFRILPTDIGTSKQMYLPETNVLLTRFLCPGGVGEVTDFMLPYREGDPADTPTDLVRRVKVIRGVLRFRLICHPAFDYARGNHRLKVVPGGAIFSFGSVLLGLSSPVEVEARNQAVEAEFELQEGQSFDFLLRQVGVDGGSEPIEQSYDGEAAFSMTVDYWRRWAAGVKYQGRWREMVLRSALALKLLSYEPTGAIVAAPTTSLPEDIGGVRNWDYRYTWIRDAAFTIYAFVRLGLTREAERFMEWIDQRAHERAPDGALQIMYGVRGEHSLPEVSLTHLEGYRSSAPVRVGNAAAGQLQLDIYGELMDAAYLSNKYGRPTTYELWGHLRELANYVVHNWRKKDEGIWEIRGGRHHMVYSKLMCWVALDRAIRLAEKRSFPAPREQWIRTRDKIYDEIMAKGWNESRQAFVQHYDTDALDASNLIMPLTFFIAPTDPRMNSTLDALCKTLVSDGLIYRYENTESS
ncbi:MAG: glycoside hydrolase family 15 protein, partial [Candidatus Obscuribacterales bacterium]